MLTNKIWIFGEHLLNRWRWMPFQLAEAWRGGLPAYRAHDGAVLVPDGCMECCRATAEGLPGCDNPDLCEIDIPQRGYDANGYEEEWTLYIDAGNLGQRLRDQLFDLSEAQAFEQARGIRVFAQGAVDGSQEWPDNPLDLGKLLVAKGYLPHERISRMRETFPRLSTEQIGAYARGLEPGENSKAANKKWYQDNKPR